jgi:hypothetical protein
MFRKSFISILLLGAVIIISSCEDDSKTLEIPVRYDTSILLGTHATYYDMQEIRFTFDIAVYKGDNELNEVIEFTDLPDTSFKFTDYVYNGDSVKHFVDKVEYTDSATLPPFTTLVLIDQSSSPENFDETDYYNLRFQAFNTFYKNLDGKGKVCFAYFNRRQGAPSVLTPINNDASGEWNEDVARQLLNLTHNQSGTSALYDALDQAISFISVRGTENISITLFVRNKDDGKSSVTLDEVILKAREKNVKINVIWLIPNTHTTSVDFNTLWKLSTKTDGFTVYMSRILQSNTVFIQLAKLLRMETNFYRVSGRITIPPPSFFNQVSYKTGVYLYYYPPGPFIASWIPLYFEKN